MEKSNGLIPGVIMIVVAIIFTSIVFSIVGYTPFLLLYLAPFGTGVCLTISGVKTLVRRV